MPLKPIKTKSRIEEIKQQPKWAFRYALTNLNQRWPAAEPTIMKDPFWATEYAKHVIKGRWPEAEPMIMKNSVAKLIYTQHVIDRYKKF